ncbi:ferric reductase-like protein transmembrane component 4 [Microthyrium microscopicum]|uniref:Ferric reductase-like protein transmembrane component 4 n=1 Tax=Microthyrium microscopicum TaxID=703497 RepID=A0A6A6U0W6_9PEZI|nr:ferric reductase-like protein transmembrane component 4 [Microthyrium microscopicum]
MKFQISVLLAQAFIVPSLGMTSAGRRGHGLVGYGISMYRPVCAFACRDILSSATLNCTMAAESMPGMSMDMGEATTDPSCYATDDSFLQTLAYCISTRCQKESVPIWKIEKWWQLNVAGIAAQQPDPKESYQQALEKVSTPPTEVHMQGDPLNKTSLTDDTDYLTSWNADWAFPILDKRSETFGLVIMLSGVAFPIGFSLLRFLPFPALWWSKLNSWVIDPPLIGNKHSTPVLWNLFLMPTRGQALLIGYFTLINIVFASAGIFAIQPNSWNPGDNYGWLLTIISDRMGVLSFANLPLVFLYAGRNNFLLWITNWSHSTFMLLHRYLAVLAMLQAVLHSILWLRLDSHSGGLLAEQREPYWYWGAIGTLGLAILIPTSILPLRRKFYELFLAWHVAISILVVAGSYWHIVFRFEHQWGYEVWMFIVMAIWAFDRILRFLRLARNGIKYAHITIIDDDYVRVTVDGVAGNGHAYLYFPTLTWRVWENHPFSVASTTLPVASHARVKSVEQDIEKHPDVNTTRLSDSIESSSTHSAHGSHKTALTFLLRTQSGLTRHLRAKGGSIPVLVESGYGSHPDLSEYATLIAIAGGVGITAILPLVRAHTGRTKLYWGARTQALIDDFAGPLAHVSKETFVGKRMVIADVLEQELRGETERVVVVVSGPHGMADEVRDVVCKLGRTERVAVQLLEESFSW